MERGSRPVGPKNGSPSIKGDGEMSDKIWQAKLAAYIHDPATKALILLRGIAHEEGSVKDLRESIFSHDEWSKLEPVVRKADHWASAADRPQLPMSLRVGTSFVKDPALIHPLSGEYFSMQRLTDQEIIEPKTIEELNFFHFNNFIVKNDSGNIDWKKTFLSFWRFGKEPPSSELGVLWGELPADTRSPDHSIWEHLSLTSVFAGALAEEENGGPALLLVSFGPVQGFISQARSVSDLWAGSHLLSTIAWQGMKVICEEFGPDAVLFPSLHGVPLVDVWLRHKKKIPWPDFVVYPRGASDANPLFVAALPNRFVALVPEKKAEKLASKVKETVRTWCLRRAKEVLKEIGLRCNDTAEEQVRRQFKDFPEVYWVIVPWRLGGMTSFDDGKLREALCVLGFEGSYLDKTLDGLLQEEIKIAGEEFYTPNPGVSYPGLIEALERLHASVKLERTFDATKEEGYRCSICGEREWLTDDVDALEQPPGKRGQTVWSGLEGKGVKKGEHLCGRCALKRFWPRLFVRWAEERVPELKDDEKSLRRYVVSTHTMALATSVWNLLIGEGHKKEQEEESGGKKEARRFLLEEMKEFHEGAALPRKLYFALKNSEDLEFFRRLPPFLDALSDEEKQDLYEKVQSKLKDLFGHRPETYYGFILMDGDEMGKWLAGKKGFLTLGKRFHERVREELLEKGLEGYLNAQRPTSPAWHQAISSALNSFSLYIARFVVEDLFMGKLIYAGGDDLLAMVAVHDLPAMMLVLRCAYSGVFPWKGEGDPWEWLTGHAMPEGVSLKLKGGYSLLSGYGSKRLLRMMGEKATASMGAVIAHHKTPLSRVLRLLRAMEKRAKSEGGRDAFSIALVKRSGSEIWFDGKWNLNNNDLFKSEMGLLIRTRDLLARKEISRRAAYILIETLRDIPAEQSALAAVMSRQFRQQGARDELLAYAEQLASDLAEVASKHSGGVADKEWEAPNLWLRNVFITAEFLARNGRAPERNGKESKNG